jgi:23S rRNA pseudouridine2457 synthase
MEHHRHFKIFKPFGMLSQMHSRDPKEKNKRFLRELFEFPEKLMPVGRLDEKSEGLLLLTTDGKLSDRINRSGIEKQYFVQVDGTIDSQAIEKLKSGVEIGISGSRYRTLPCQAGILDEMPELPPAHRQLRINRHRPSSWLTITIREGKYRQVRKMTAAVGYPTLRLIRVRIGDIDLSGLQPGDVREMKSLEV